jgi:N utilization substance protein B
VTEPHPHTGGDTESPAIRGAARQSARLSAVQALYQIELSGAEAETVIAEFSGQPLSDETAEFDPAHFASVVTIANQNSAEIDTLIAGVLKEDWNISRLGALMRALLRAATAELLRRPDVPAKVVISEYVTLSRRFFLEGEPAFVNGALDGLAHKLRAKELTSS